MQTERLSRGEITIQKTVFTTDTGVHKVHLLITGPSADILSIIARPEGLAQILARGWSGADSPGNGTPHTNARPEGLARKVADESGMRVVFLRFFVSDIDRQEPLIRSVLKAAGNTTPTSIIGQAPADGSPIALWAYLSNEPNELWFTSLGSVLPDKQDSTRPEVSPGMDLSKAGGLAGCQPGDGAKRIPREEVLPHTNARPVGLAQKTETGAYAQTVEAFSDLIARLKANGLTLADHCQRTWLFIDDIDHNYADVVRARNDVFDREGLTTDTHFIASTGIAGKPYQKAVKVDAVVYPDVPKENISYLYAPDNMNRTSEYGVRFERGTVVRLTGYSQVFISGTASINNRGEVVHKGDVIKQAERMMKNIKALLAEAHCTTDDIQQAVVYLRHADDYCAVDQWFSEYYPAIPHIIVHAPVCRPDWLIETECMAISNEQLAMRNEKLTANC